MKILIVLLTLSLSGCVAMDATMYNPDTNQSMNCSAQGFGWLGVPLALAQQAECKKRLREAGYREE